MSRSGRTLGARVFPVPPPLYYAAAMGVGLRLQQRWPLDLPGGPVTTGAGAAALAAGVALVGGGVAGVVRRGTTIVPHRSVSELVTTGVYSWSRNPMYTGLGLAVLGGSLLARAGWPLILLPGTLLAVRLIVIDPEETYLSERFGGEYAHYRASVPRWL